MTGENIEKFETNDSALVGAKSRGETLSAIGDAEQINATTTNGVKNTTIANCHGGVTDEYPQRLFGWFGCRPKFLQTFLSAKWALFWLCWAGALQGKIVVVY